MPKKESKTLKARAIPLIHGDWLLSLAPALQSALAVNGILDLDVESQGRRRVRSEAADWQEPGFDYHPEARSMKRIYLA